MTSNLLEFFIFDSLLCKDFQESHFVFISVSLDF